MNVNHLELNKKFEDPTKGRTVLLNICTRGELVNFPEIKGSYDLLYPAYQPEVSVINDIKQLSGEQKITVVLGTWCGDSKLQVPHFFKIADQLSIAEENMQLICVDGKKQAENGLLDGLNITQVPTFIFYREDRELGRIIESPQTTLEYDLLTLLKR
jgi:thiol-disulfide isomerase/thioredoxin